MVSRERSLVAVEMPTAERVASERELMIQMGRQLSQHAGTAVQDLTPAEQYRKQYGSPCSESPEIHPSWRAKSEVADVVEALAQASLR